MSRMVENSKRNYSSLKDVLKNELKLKIYEDRKAFPTAEELDQIFNSCVVSKEKKDTSLAALIKKTVDPEKLPEIENKLNYTEGAVFNLMGKVDAFSKTVGEELDEITAKLQKVRDQLANKDSFK